MLIYPCINSKQSLKKHFPVCVLAASILLCVVIMLANRPEVLESDDELIEKVREIIPVSDSYDTEIIIAGVAQNKEYVLMWFVSGNSYQTHYYLPVEFSMAGDSSYVFKRAYRPLKRGDDISVLHWKGGISFIINNPRCTSLRIEDDSDVQNISIDQYPYVYYHPRDVISYYFLGIEQIEKS